VQLYLHSLVATLAQADRRLRLFLQAEHGIRDATVTGVQTCALPISLPIGETWEGTVALEDPARYAAVAFSDVLEARGIRVTGPRSEERRVGKECTGRRTADSYRNTSRYRGIDA